MDPSKIDKQEDERVKAMRKAARSRPHLTFAGENCKRVKFVTLNRKIMGYSSPAALGDAVRRELLRQEWRESQREVGMVQHVKDGKPLTEKGAQMLGVPWVPTEIKENQG